MGTGIVEIIGMETRDGYRYCRDYWNGDTKWVKVTKLPDESLLSHSLDGVLLDVPLFYVFPASFTHSLYYCPP